MPYTVLQYFAKLVPGYNKIYDNRLFWDLTFTELESCPFLSVSCPTIPFNKSEEMAQAQYNAFFCQQDALSDIQLDRVKTLMTPPGALRKASIVCFIHFNNLSH